MSNLIKNPSFALGLSEWTTDNAFSYDFSDQELAINFTGKITNIFLTQEVFLSAGDYFCSIEISTECRFAVEIVDVANSNILKKSVYDNGSISGINFGFNVDCQVLTCFKILFLKALPTNKVKISYICIHKNGVNSSPYLNAHSKQFWGGAVAKRSYFDLNDLSKHHDVLSPGYKYATAGSCFAQHISRHLKMKGLSCLDLEPSPTELTKSEAYDFGFGQFTCRYGNIYTARQLYQLFLESENRFFHGDDIWCKDGRFYDALRPSLDPVGYRRPEFVKSQRAVHLKAVSNMWRTFDVFVFTLGLTECWVSKQFGTAYPTAPGTVAGVYDSNNYEFINLNYEQIYSDLSSFWSEVKKINPRAKILLTVSPVPLTATATDEHVLVATTYSKSVLRAVAGDFVKNSLDAYYFPSFEIISSHPSRTIFYEPNLRSINKAGVDFVMNHFFSSNNSSFDDGEQLVKISNIDEACPEFEIFCDDELLNDFDKK
jgi:hypothetical protein